jgi:hypothetical protein
MTIDVRRKYLKKLQPRYLAAVRAEKSRLLTEMALVTQLHRKSLVQLLNQHSLEHSRHVNRRSRHYGLAVEQAVAIVWESVDYLCAERIQPALLPTAQHLARFGKLQLTPDLEAQLAQISVSTLQRLLDGSVDRPLIPERAGTGEPAAPGAPDAAPPLGDGRARTLRGGSGPSCRGKHSGGVWPYPVTDRCGDRLE